MAGLARTAFGLAFIWLLGALLLSALGLRARRWPLGYAQPALDFAVGAAVLATVWTLAALVGWRVAPELIYLLAAALAIPAGLLAAGPFRGSRPEPEEAPTSNGRTASLALVAAALLLLVLVGGAAHAYATGMFWDGRYIWAFKAKAMFADGTLDREAFSNLARYRYTHVDYPLAVPAAQAWLYQVMGQVDERRAKLVGIVCWAGIAAVLACYLRRWMTLPWALGVTLLTCQIPVLAYHAGGGGADVPQALYFLGGGLLLADWAERRRPADAALSMVMFGAGSLVKPEGLSMAIGAALVFAITCLPRDRAPRPRLLAAAASALLLAHLPWALLRARWAIPSPQLTRMHLRPLPELAERLGAIAASLFRHALTWPAWELSWVFVALGLLAWVAWARGRAALAVLWGLLVWQLAIYVAIYATSPYDITWHISTSLDRLLIHLAPLAMAAAACSLAEAAPRA